MELALSGASLHMWDLSLVSGEVRSHTGAWALIGYPPDKITGPLEAWLDLVHPDDLPQALEDLQWTIVGVRSFYESEIRIETLTGEWIWAAIRGAVVERDGDGSPLKLSGTIGDTTSRKKLEGDAQTTSKSFFNMVEGSADGILVLDLEGVVLYANASAGALFRREVDELVGMPFGIPLSSHLCEVGVVCGLGPPHTAEMRTSQTIWRGEKAWMILLRDVTERKSYEESLKKSEERLRQVIEAAPVGIKIVQDGACQYANPAFLNMMGYQDSSEVIGKRVEELYHEDERRLVAEQESQWLQQDSESTALVERRALKSSGETLDVYLWLKKIIYEGKPSLLGFALDLTEEKALREQLIQAQKMEAIGALAGGIAHDFNNVLTVVSGFSEFLLQEKKEGDGDYEDLRKITIAARRGAELVRGLLALSRKAKTEPRPINLNREVEQVVSLVSRTIPKMIAIRTELSQDLLAANADPSQFEQALFNLVVNAKDAMPTGGELIIATSNVTLDEAHCRLHPDSRPGEHIMVSVTDSGHGMDSSTVSRIFEPFFTTKPPGEGTGLGLAMVYGIVKRHEGFITCQSAPGKGATFRMYWPALHVAAEEQAPAPQDSFEGGDETILVVDDEELVRDFTRRLLTRAGYTVISAENGRKGLEAFERDRSRISLVLLDIIMPVMGGKECLEEMLKIDPTVNVVLATGHMSGDSGNIDAHGMGAKAFVKKPYHMAELLKVVRQCLDENSGPVE